MKNYFFSSRPLIRGEKQKGMSLIEVLVSMLVVGLALVTSISMIQSANRFGNSAEYSSTALNQTQAIIDKIRANKIGIDSYIFTGSATAVQIDNAIISGVYDNIFGLVNMGNIPNTLANVCSRTPCTTTSVATAHTDMTQWAASLGEALPEGRGIVRLLDADRGSYEVVVMWRNIAEIDNNPAANANAQGIHLRFSL